MSEVILLRKRSAKRKLTLDGPVLRVQGGGGKESRTSYANAVMARARRDGLVAELVVAGWSTEAAAKVPRPKKKKALVWDDVVVVGKTSALAPLPRVAHRWPEGYADYLERFGPSAIEGLHVFDTKERAKRAKLWQKLVPHLGAFFENLREHFPDQDEAEVIVVAASDSGDSVGFAPSRPDQILLFPRGSQRIVAMGTTWPEAMATWCFGEHTGPRRVEGRPVEVRRAGS